MKEVKAINLETAKAIYQQAVQAYKDKNKDNWWKNHSWPWGTTGIERAGMFLVELAKVNSIEGLMNIIADKKYNTGTELLGIIKNCTLKIFEPTQDEINKKAKDFEHCGSSVRGGPRGPSIHIPAVKYTDPIAQTQAKDEIFKDLITPYQQRLILLV